MTVQTWADDDQNNISYYSKLVKEHGINPRALDWGGAGSQWLRFAVLADVGPLAHASILDVGCGQGDFCLWLAEAGIPVEYRGIDITPAMVEVARSRFPGVRFEARNLLEQPPADESFDYVFASGIFAHRLIEPMQFLRQMVKTMFRSCRKGIAFNSLSGWASQKEETEFYPDPLETVRACFSETPWVVMRHDYHSRDFTIYMRKMCVL